MAHRKHVPGTSPASASTSAAALRHRFGSDPRHGEHAQGSEGRVDRHPMSGCISHQFVVMYSHRSIDSSARSLVWAILRYRIGPPNRNLKIKNTKRAVRGYCNFQTLLLLNRGRIHEYPRWDELGPPSPVPSLKWTGAPLRMTRSWPVIIGAARCWFSCPWRRSRPGQATGQGQRRRCRALQSTASGCSP